MLIYLNSLKSETIIINKLMNFDKKNKIKRRKSLHINMKIDIFLDNQIVDLII